jgi:hypothetical protein
MRNSLFYIAGILLISLAAGKARAQISTKSTYIYFKPIYAFPGNKSKLNETTATLQGIDYTTGVYGSYARGFCFQGGIGKMISNHLGFELAAEWVQGVNIKTSAVSDDDNDNLNGLLSERVRAALLKPMLVFRNSGDLLAFYTKMGLAISVYCRHYADISISGNSAGQDYLLNTSQVNNTRAKVGFAAAFGLSARVSQSIAINGEIGGQMISIPGKDGHYTGYWLNGKDQLSTLATNERSWIYTKTTSTAPIPDNQPGQRLFEPANFSYVGISVGITYYF